MNQLSASINGQKKIIINNETKKEEEILFLFSNPINNNQLNDKNSQTSVCEFILGQKLGEGTFGTVRLGVNRQTGEKVAIKILEKAKMNNFDDKQRLEREINLLKRIHHPNIVKLFCVIETDRQIFIVMEYIKGNELFQYILIKKKLEEEEACYFFLHIINCIDYLNKLKISHRDLKAENIIIEQNTKEIKMIDFGLSNTYENGNLLSTACGSPIYAAPEMLEGKLYKGSTVDIWSAGIVLFYMLSGNFPFEDISNDKLYKKILKGKFEMPKYFSKDAKDLINKILVVNPKKRISLKNIKSHQWILNYLKKNKNFEKIFKNIGLNVGKYVIPIDEDIVNEINNRYKANKVEIRKSILYNITNDLSTLYYLILNKKCKEGIKSIADMKSDLFENYIKDKTNLLSEYNNNINIIFNKRKNGLKEENDNKSQNKDNEDIEKNENEVKIVSQNENKILEGSQSYTNILNNENNNNSISIKNNNTTIDENRFIIDGKTNNKRNQKIKQININNNKIRDYKKCNYNQLSLNLTLRKDETMNNKKKVIFNEKNKINKKSSNKNVNSSINKNNCNNSLSRTTYNKNKKNTILQKKDDKKIKTDKKENLNEKELKKRRLNKSVEINNQNKYNNDDLDIKKSDYGLKEENSNYENKEKDNISEFRYSDNINKEDNLNTPSKIDKEIKLNNLDDNKNENKDDINLNYFSLNENTSIEKHKKNNTNNFSNLKVKNNRLVLFKDIKNKDLKNNNISDKKGNKNPENGKVDHSKKEDNFQNFNNKNEQKENKNDNKNEKKYSFNNKIYKANEEEELHHKKNASLITKPSMNINNEKDNINSKKNLKLIKKQKNKSMEMYEFNKKEINYENLNNKVKNSNIKNNIINKIKLIKNNKIKKIDYSTKPSTTNTNLDKNKIENTYKPIDINCIFIENEKIIKNEFIKLLGNKNFKIKNIKTDKYSINFKLIDLLVEISIEKINDAASIFKIKKLKGNNLEYSKQLNNILKELNLN